MNEAADTCPKCDKPRFDGAIDCPFCGIVFARYTEERAAVEVAAVSTPPDPDLQQAPADVYQGPSLDNFVPGAALEGGYQEPLVESAPSGPAAEPRRPGSAVAGGVPLPQPGAFKLHGAGAEPRSGIGALLNRDLGTSLLVVAGIYLLAQLVLATQIVGGATELGSVQRRFLALSGLEAPESLRDAGSVRFVGRDFVWFAGAGGSVPTVVLLIRHRTLSGWKSSDELSDKIQGWMNDLGVEWEGRDPTPIRIGTQPGTIEVLELGPSERPTGRGALVSFERDGVPTLLILFGSRDRYAELAKQYVRRASTF